MFLLEAWSALGLLTSSSGLIAVHVPSVARVETVRGSGFGSSWGKRHGCWEVKRAGRGACGLCLDPVEIGREPEAAAGRMGSGGQPQREAGRGLKARKGTKLSIFSPLGMVPGFLTYVGRLRFLSKDTG